MRIGYACQNLTLGTISRTFRLASYSEERLFETVALNLADARRMVEFNAEHGLGLLRLSAALVPFASHDVMAHDWRARFADEFRELGRVAHEAGIRLSVHPGQFVLINSPRAEVNRAAVRELVYAAEMMDLIGDRPDEKIQIHVGGVYGDRAEAMARWVVAYRELPEIVRRRLVIENDERSFPLADCLRLHGDTGVPVLFDSFHHLLLNHGEPMSDATRAAGATWNPLVDGPPQMDYSSQDAEKRPGAHTPTILESDFAEFLTHLSVDADLMMEIKDKEASALKALAIARAAGRGPTAYAA